MSDSPDDSDDTPQPGYARGQLVLAAAGFVGGTLCDQIHVRFGVLSYAHPVLAGQAIWVPFLFAAAALLLANGYAVIGPRWGGDGERPHPALIGVASALFVAAYFSTGIFQRTPVAETIGLCAAWALYMAVLRRKQVIVYSLLCAIGGPLFEAALSSTGTFSYARADWVVPMWLPGLYLFVGPLGAFVQRALLAPRAAGVTFVYRH